MRKRTPIKPRPLTRYQWKRLNWLIDNIETTLRDATFYYGVLRFSDMRIMLRRVRNLESLLTLTRRTHMTGPDMGSGEVGRVVTPGYGTGKKSSGPRHDKPGVTKSPAPKVPTHPAKPSAGKGRGGKRGR